MTRKRLGWGYLMLIVALAISGCVRIVPPVPQISLTISPERGHPPFEVEVEATAMDGGTYAFSLPGEVIEQDSNVLVCTVDSDPWTISVRWTSSDGVQRSATAAADVVNAPPLIRRPTVLPGAGWFLQPRVRTILDFNHRAGAGETSGIYDPDGDAWHIESVSVLCKEKHGLEDSVFRPPLEPGTYQATYQNGVLPNACVIYPTYTGELSAIVASAAPLSERVEFVEPFTYGDPGAQERFTVKNTGTHAIDLSGWTVTSDAGAVYRFPYGFMLYASASVSVHTRSGTDTLSDLYWDHAGSEVWDDVEGQAVLRDPSGDAVHEYTYPGYPYPLSAEAGYPHDPTVNRDMTIDYLTDWYASDINVLDWADEYFPDWASIYQGTTDEKIKEIRRRHLPTMRASTATIRVIAVDEWGARSKAEFEIPVGSRTFAAN